MDVMTAAQRSHNMSRIRSRNTKPELGLKTVLKSMGFVYQPKGVYGNPDFINKGKKIAIFVDGCFWHGCPDHYRAPKSNVRFWKAKIKRNIERDRKVTSELKKGGFTVIRTWEHQIKAI